MPYPNRHDIHEPVPHNTISNWVIEVNVQCHAPQILENTWFFGYGPTLGGSILFSRTSWETKNTKLANLWIEIFRLRLFPAPAEHSFPGISTLRGEHIWEISCFLSHWVQQIRVVFRRGFENICSFIFFLRPENERTGARMTLEMRAIERSRCGES